MTTPYTTLTPRLVVDDAESMIQFYERVFGAAPGMVLKTPTGQVIHAELRMGDMLLSLTEDDGSANRSPKALGGSPVILTWLCDDPDLVETAAFDAGARIVFPVADQFYGMREGRFEDPAGHLWIVTKVIAQLSEDALQKKVDEEM